MSELTTTSLENEIAAIETRLRQLESDFSFSDSVIYKTALLLAKTRQKFEKDHPANFSKKSFKSASPVSKMMLLSVLLTDIGIASALVTKSLAKKTLI
jgi:hypothetical protein